MAFFIKLCDVEIPVDVSDFITPDWRPVLNFHATWIKKVDWKKWGEPWPFQPYMLDFAKSLERLGRGDLRGTLRERTADEWIQRCLQHFGLSFLEYYAKLAVAP
jgi:hypothetical protein